MTTARQGQRVESTESPERPDDSESFSDEAVFEALANRRRRHVLRALTEREEDIEIGPLAEQVAAWENDTTVDAVTSAQRKSTYTSLHQLHLPKLEELGFVGYDKRSGTVSATEALEVVTPHLYDEEEPSFPWSTYYLGLSGVLGVVVLLAWLAVFPFSAIPSMGWALVTVGLVGVSALVHRVSDGYR